MIDKLPITYVCTQTVMPKASLVLMEQQGYS